MRKKTVREVALDILLQIEKQQAYSNLLLNQRVKNEKLDIRDVGLLTEIVYGTVQRRDTLDFYLKSFVKKGLAKLDDWVHVLLRLSLYQMVYLDRVPHHAIINEAVTIAKKRAHQGVSGMVNGVLRNIGREGVPSTDSIKDELARISIETSHPEWLIRRWADQFGLEEATHIAKMNLLPPSVSIRVNKTLSTRDEAIAALKEEGLTIHEGDVSPDSIIIDEGYVPATRLFKEGIVTIQDESSMLVARALEPNGNSKVLDTCAAPGGKTTHLSERMNNSGHITALDLHPHKIKLIQELQTRLKLTNIETAVMDARKASEQFEQESFDYILVDAPCSGLGVIRRKPDIKWTKTMNDMNEISKIQREILHSAASLLKKGGRLVYSTCTIDRIENEEVVKEFLQQNPQFSLDKSLQDRLPEKVVKSRRYEQGQVTILPHDFGTDGFYIAALIKE